jgi:hypothetical protein
MKSALLFLVLLAQTADNDVFYRSATQQAENDETYPCGIMSEQMNTHKLPKDTKISVTEGKALLYVMVEYAGIYQNRIAVDGHWVGATKGRGHIAVELEPGEHRLCAKLRTVEPAFTKLKAEAGETYYLRVWFVKGFTVGRIAFETLDDKVALRELPKSTLYRTTLKE